MRIKSPSLFLFFTTAIASAIISLAPMAIVYATPPPGYSLVYSDDFATDTALDTTHWTYMYLGDGLFGGGYSATNAVVFENGHLALKAYTGSNGAQYFGIIGGQNKYQPKYGYIEAGIQWKNTPGNWSALWTYVDTIGGDGGVLLPHTDGVENDIAEHRDVDENNVDNVSNQIDIALHWDGYGTSEQSYSPSSLLGSGLGSGYHIYGMAWTPTTQTFYIDNVQQWTVTNDSTDANPLSPNAAVPQISEYLMLSTLVQGGSWAGNIPTGGYGSLATTTTEMDVEYVGVYQMGPPTPLAPVNVTVAPSADGWVLGWDLTDNAPYYNVQRSTVSGGPYTTIATTGIAAIGANYVDTTAVSGTTYYYVVSAVNGTQQSPNSLEVCTNDAAVHGTAHTGQWGAEAIFGGSATYDRIMQTATVAANTTYQYGVWARGSGTITLRAYGSSGTQLGETVVKGSPAWTYYSVPFNSGTNTQVTIRVDDESGIVGAMSLDDFFLGVAGGTNLLTNPGFESGSTGWNLTYAGTVWKIVDCGGVTPGNEYDGYQSAKAVFSGTPTYDRMTQTAWVTANTTYQYGFWVQGGGTTSLRVYAGTSGSQISSTVSVTATSTWTYHSVSFNSGSNTQVTVRMDDESSVATTMYIDDVFLGIAGGTNVLANPNFERGTVAWSTQYGGNVWTIGEW